mmetsp:Transcript_48528/g.115548  ORF Transcript_48528/g.115548 Transcript_48528/m.115548 type:complete len:210 (-) Transcript_48528:4655-5284(-)
MGIPYQPATHQRLGAVCVRGGQAAMVLSARAAKCPEMCFPSARHCCLDALPSPLSLRPFSSSSGCRTCHVVPGMRPVLVQQGLSRGWPHSVQNSSNAPVRRCCLPTPRRLARVQPLSRSHSKLRLLVGQPSRCLTHKATDLSMHSATPLAAAANELADHCCTTPHLVHPHRVGHLQQPTCHRGGKPSTPPRGSCAAKSVEPLACIVQAP